MRSLSASRSKSGSTSRMTDVSGRVSDRGGKYRPLGMRGPWGCVLHHIGAPCRPKRTKMDRRRFLSGCIGLSPWLASRAFAQSGPLTKIVFPFAAGGGGDMICRLLADHLRVALDRQIIVE